MTETYPTSKKDFQLFQDEFKYWLNVWGLMDWEIWFDHKELEGCRAQIYVNETGRIATAELNSEWDNPFDEAELARVAFHEARELFYGVLSQAARNRFVTRDQIEEAVHGCIRIDENTIWEDYWRNKMGCKGKKKPKGK